MGAPDYYSWNERTLMRVHLAYGKTGLEIDAPADRTTVIAPRFLPAVPDAADALHQALANPIRSRPLRQLVTAGQRVGIIVSDLTRPMPTAAVVRAIMAELPHAPAGDITIFIGLGTHRKMTDAEVRSVLGDLADRCQISQTDCSDDAAFTTIGRSKDGAPIRFVSDFLACPVRIVTGLMEPHLFAGVSGGPKGILPGLAHMDTIIANHSPAHLLHRKATYGVTQGNPLWEEIHEAALLAQPTFLVNVTVNKDKEITAVFAGDMDAAHEQGAQFVRETAMAAVPQQYDVVVTTNSGYPLDLNLYQAVKGMTAAAPILKPGGALIVAAECWDGLPFGSRMESILRSVKTPEEIIAGVESGQFAGMDQWQVLLYAQVLQKATVYLKTSYLSDADVRACLAIPCADISATLRDLLQQYGSHSTACILPEGPQTIPYLT
jgi:nickel-dependent lactate racemase